jgi:hypothetical protein
MSVTLRVLRRVLNLALFEIQNLSYLLERKTFLNNTHRSVEKEDGF